MEFYNLINTWWKRAAIFFTKPYKKNTQDAETQLTSFKYFFRKLSDHLNISQKFNWFD